MANVARYNAKDCSITVDGVFITGLGENMITFEKEEAYFNLTVGAQGDVVKSEINNPIHKLTLTVQSTSPQLPYLLKLMGQSSTFSVWVTNKELGMRMGGSKANITEMPSIELGAEAADVEINISVFDGVLEAI